MVADEVVVGTEPTALGVVVSPVVSPGPGVPVPFNCDRLSRVLFESSIAFDISVVGGAVVDSRLDCVVAFRDACKRDRISCAKSINLGRNVVVGTTVVVSASTMLLEIASVVGISVELKSAD